MNEFEDMMDDLMGGDNLEGELRDGVTHLIILLGAIYDEMILGGFDEKQSFEFAKEFILNMIDK